MGYKIPQKAQTEYTKTLPASHPGSRTGWYMDECKVHGNTSHNTIVGCETCARERLNEMIFHERT